jgi:hypothetical protein
VLPSLCLLAMTGSVALHMVTLPSGPATLAWTHSIEKQRWEEDYRVVLTPTGPGLQMTEARIRGSAAGMEPPEGAILRQGWYVYTPVSAPKTHLRLLADAYTDPYELCVGGECKPLEAWSPGVRPEAWELRPCP